MVCTGSSGSRATRATDASPGLDTLAGARYSTTECGADPGFVGRVGKAPWRLTVSRPHPRRAVGTSPGLDTLAGARYSTTECGADPGFVGRVGKAPGA